MHTKSIKNPSIPELKARLLNSEVTSFYYHPASVADDVELLVGISSNLPLYLLDIPVSMAEIIDVCSEEGAQALERVLKGEASLKFSEKTQDFPREVHLGYQKVQRYEFVF